MYVLGIETSCDETAVSIVSDSKQGGVEIHSNFISSQDQIHKEYGGVVPELASRQHMEALLPMISNALADAKVSLDDIGGIAVTNRPGLLGSLLVGLQVAKGIALSKKIPFMGVSHLEGHLYAPILENPNLKCPYIGLLVSGGHTLLYEVKGFGEYRLLGGTRDDAAGEAFDKVAKLLGLGYPGGPLVDKKAKEGNRTAIKFPKGKIKGKPYDFSFSGLKTSVLNYVRKTYGDEVPASKVADICASFQEAVVEDLSEKVLLAAADLKINDIAISGGVACNSRLREKLPNAIFPNPLLCTDNAAMIAAVGLQYLKRGIKSDLSLNAFANQDLTLE